MYHRFTEFPGADDESARHQAMRILYEDSIDVAMKYYDKTQFGRDRTPGDPQGFHIVNSLVWRCGAAPRLEAPSGCFAGGYGVRALPVLTAHDISLPEQ